MYYCPFSIHIILIQFLKYLQEIGVLFINHLFFLIELLEQATRYRAFESETQLRKL